ncbi:MAG: acyltransferase [Bacteroidota bacterium]
MKKGKNAVIEDYVIIKRPEHFEIGDHSRVSAFCRLSTKIKIGNYCDIATGTSIAGGSKQFILGDFSSIAAGCKIWLESDDYVNGLVAHVPEFTGLQGDVEFSKYTGLGSNSVVMPNNHIPEGTVIGAMSFVPYNFKFEPWTVYAGTPIKKIKSRNKENVLELIEKMNLL